MDDLVPSLESSPVPDELPAKASWKGPWIGAGIGVPLLICASIFLLNLLMIGRPVSTALAEDARNKGFTLSARYGYYVDWGTLVLDLQRFDGAAPIDLYRGIFQSADALHAREFKRVVLACHRNPVFVMEGSEFAALGVEVAGGENPVYMVRTLPEKLYHPDGTSAFGHWEGGILGVLNGQLKDVNEMSSQWIAACG